MTAPAAVPEPAVRCSICEQVIPATLRLDGPHPGDLQIDDHEHPLFPGHRCIGSRQYAPAHRVADRVEPQPAARGDRVEFGSGAKTCGCPVLDGTVRHDRATCDDPVVAKLGWYADEPAPEPLLCWCCAQYGLTAHAIDARTRLCTPCTGRTRAECKPVHVDAALAAGAEATA